MNKVKCMKCSKELISTHRHNLVSCNCPNDTFVDGGDVYIKVGANDLSKVGIWDEEDAKFKKTVM